MWSIQLITVASCSEGHELRNRARVGISVQSDSGPAPDRGCSPVAARSQHTGIVHTTASLPVRELRAIYGGWALCG